MINADKPHRVRCSCQSERGAAADENVASVSVSSSEQVRQERLVNRRKDFLADEDGPAIVEYALLLGLLVLMSVTTMGGFGVGMHQIYVIISGALL